MPCLTAKLRYAAPAGSTSRQNRPADRARRADWGGYGGSWCRWRTVRCRKPFFLFSLPSVQLPPAGDARHVDVTPTVMKPHTEHLTVTVSKRMEFINITPRVEQALTKSRIREGPTLIKTVVAIAVEVKCRICRRPRKQLAAFDWLHP